MSLDQSTNLNCGIFLSFYTNFYCSLNNSLTKREFRKCMDLREEFDHGIPIPSYFQTITLFDCENLAICYGMLEEGTIDFTLSSVLLDHVNKVKHIFDNDGQQTHFFLKTGLKKRRQRPSIGHKLTTRR